MTMYPPSEASVHLSSEEIAAYLDHVLSVEDRLRFEAHLAECEFCRAEVVEVGRLLSTMPTEGRRFPVVPAAGLVAAAVVALLLVVRPGPVVPPPTPYPVRSEATAMDAEGTPLFSIIRPEAGSPVGPENLRFAWQAASDEALYRITVTDATGELVWEADTGDTEIDLPARVELRPATTYFWRVDALLSDGRSATTRVHDFSTP